MINWDNYPNNATGGVYAWADALISGMPDFRFVILNCLSNPNSNGHYKIPKHVTRVIEMPLYGCQRYEEFYRHENSPVVSKILRTNEDFVQDTFLPEYATFLSHLFSDSLNSGKLSGSAIELHTLLAGHDVKKCLENPRSFEIFLETFRRDLLYQQIPLKDLLNLFQLVQRMIQILSIKIPDKIDLVHSSNAWFPALVGICAKHDNACPMIVTEHGVAFKDLLLYQRLFTHNEASNILWKVFSRNIIRTVCEAADIVSPVCYANGIAEQTLGVDEAKIRVIYNGVDTSRFRPVEVPFSTLEYLDGLDRDARRNEVSSGKHMSLKMTDKGKNENEMENSKVWSSSGSDHARSAAKRPTVVYVGRIELLKDLMNLIAAIKIVTERIPNVLCLIYGASTDLEYARRCSDLVSELKLHDNVRFMGKTNEPEMAYNLGDVVVLSSVREGFPYTVIEAMACGKVVVSTDVGGIREALENYGMLVKPRHSIELAAEITKLLSDEELRTGLGDASARRVANKFSIDQTIRDYRTLYNDLIEKSMKTRQPKDVSSLGRNNDDEPSNRKDYTSGGES
jgi:glycosyltransferase involved in cell wall biosynthesis